MWFDGSLIGLLGVCILGVGAYGIWKTLDLSKTPIVFWFTFASICLVVLGASVLYAVFFTP